MLNVADPAELDKFGDLAHRWWDPNSEFKPLHDINPLRLDWIDDAIGLCRQARARCRLRRRPALRGHGGPRCRSHRHRPVGETARRRPAAPAGKRAEGRLPQDFRRTDGGGNARRLRCRDLPRDARARTRSGKHRGCPARAWSNRAARSSSRPSTATPRLTCSPSSVPNTCCRCCPGARMTSPDSSSPPN